MHLLSLAAIAASVSAVLGAPPFIFGSGFVDPLTGSGSFVTGSGAVDAMGNSFVRVDQDTSIHGLNIGGFNQNLITKRQGGGSVMVASNLVGPSQATANLVGPSYGGVAFYAGAGNVNGGDEAVFAVGI
ncbi:hypothetical protein GQ54DRAFT_298771 [Martensiomyces pterosporus]|nr:hypothetical protein GQ54DRAFT_298771 [Martensiomyces pterosporus]